MLNEPAVQRILRTSLRARATGARAIHRSPGLALALGLLLTSLEAPGAGGQESEPYAVPALISEACPAHFAAGRRPVLTNPKLAGNTVPLCFRGFAVLASGLSRTPLYAAEHLTAGRLAAAGSIDRVDAFHAETALSLDLRAELSDYAGSGYDRGHMAPSGDMPDGEAQRQSFSLANIVPQDPEDNRGLWSDIEHAVRVLARERRDLYVVTGPIFSGNRLASLKNRVLVPTRLFKAVYDPGRRTAAAYVAENAPGRAWRTVGLEALRAEAGLDPFPGAPVVGMLRLPAPEERPGVRRERRPETVSAWLEWQLRRLLRRLWRALLHGVLG